MLTGVLSILFGVMVALFPQILVAMVAGLFIVSGLMMCVLSLQWRRRRASPPPFMRWMIRW